MIITCPSCQTRYKVEAAQFGPLGRRVRCTGCAHVWTEKPADDLPKVIDPEPPRRQEIAAADGDASWGVGDPDQDLADHRAEHRGEGGPTPRSDAIDHEPEPERRRNPVGWAILAVIVATIIIGGTAARDAIIGAWPAAERLYLAFGLNSAPQGNGLKIKVLSHDRSIAGGRKFIVIKGEISNTSEQARDIPKLKASLRAADARALASWDFAAAQARLLPGESSAFETRYQNPPENATAFEIDFLQ